MSGGTVRERARQCRVRWVGRCLVGVAAGGGRGGRGGGHRRGQRPLDRCGLRRPDDRRVGGVDDVLVGGGAGGPPGRAHVRLGLGHAHRPRSWWRGHPDALLRWRAVRRHEDLDDRAQRSGRPVGLGGVRPAGGLRGAPTTPPAHRSSADRAPGHGGAAHRPPETEAPPQATPSPRPESPNPAPAVPAAPARPRAAPLPVTGGSTLAGLGLAAAAVAVGALVIRWTRRRADQFIGD